MFCQGIRHFSRPGRHGKSRVENLRGMSYKGKSINLGAFSRMAMTVVQFKDLLSLFRWQDALDVLIISFVFYRLYLRIRTKRALKMVAAILALPFFYLLARWIDLPLTVWGLQNLWSVILLFLVIIFQQEIREVLGSFSLPAFFFGRAQSLPPPAILDKITEASFRLAARGIGGLIVIEKEDNLDEFVQEKTLLDAEINEDVILSLFLPQSPLHDGAVAIRGDRIRYAAAVLPVSQTRILPKDWGTRHRAGVGITEVSDAECIIISEERREVLFASRGKVEKKQDRSDLGKAVSAFARPAAKKDDKEKFPGTVFRDLPRKAFFVFGVCLLWIFVIGIRQGEISFRVPVEFYSIPQDLTIMGDSPKEITVRFRGSQRLLSSLLQEHPRVQLNLSDTRAGTNQITISERDIPVPSGISVTALFPRRVTLQLSQAPK
jgi:diadenylate cyclase